MKRFPPPLWGRAREGGRFGLDVNQPHSAMGGLGLKTQGFRHGRVCPGHPRRSAERRFKAFAERYVDLLKLTRPFTTWMPGTSPGMTRKWTIKHPVAPSLAATFVCSRRA